MLIAQIGVTIATLAMAIKVRVPSWRASARCSLACRCSWNWGRCCDPPRNEPRPLGDVDEAAQAAHADAIARQVKALYQGTEKQEFRA